MESFKPKAAHGPEFGIQKKWIDFLESKKWLVERVVGGVFQSGLPDIFIGHKEYGTRWVDIKVYGNYNFTKAQKIKWPIWEKNNIGIWILGATSKEACTKTHMIEEYDILFHKPNWRKFWKDSWDKKPNIDKMIEELNANSKL